MWPALPGFDGDGAVLVVGLAGMRIETRVGQAVDAVVVHGKEYLSDRDRGREEGVGVHGAPTRTNGDPLSHGDPQTAGVRRIQFHIAFAGVECAQDCGFSGPGSGVPLGGGAASREQDKRKFRIDGFHHGARGIKDEPCSAIRGEEDSVAEEAWPGGSFQFPVFSFQWRGRIRIWRVLD